MKNIVKTLLPLALALPVILCVAQSAAAQDPTVVDSAHYTVDLETDDVRVVRIKYGPGEESVMHYHPKSVVVALTDGSVHFTLPDSTEMDMSLSAGQVVVTPAGAHRSKNTGDAALEVLQIELKKSEEAMEHH